MTLLDENKSTQQKTLETLQIASKWENNTVAGINLKNEVSSVINLFPMGLVSHCTLLVVYAVESRFTGSAIYRMI